MLRRLRKKPTITEKVKNIASSLTEPYRQQLIKLISLRVSMTPEMFQRSYVSLLNELANYLAPFPASEIIRLPRRSVRPHTGGGVLCGKIAPILFITVKCLDVIVYLRHRHDEHFAVIRGGVNENTIWLADPSLGNRTYSKEQFLAMWETRQDDSANSHLRGKFLAILPLQQLVPNHHFFTHHPIRQSAQSVKQLVVQTRLSP